MHVRLGYAIIVNRGVAAGDFCLGTAAGTAGEDDARARPQTDGYQRRPLRELLPVLVRRMVKAEPDSARRILLWPVQRTYRRKPIGAEGDPGKGRCGRPGALAQ